mmetsp:Transcript_26610/g.35602  ORF Transcript_26610/g.35602 Transcript_26610/m.35602 type:complete len:96 (+) Transcript_26610:702-989(+)
MANAQKSIPQRNLVRSQARSATDGGSNEPRYLQKYVSRKSKQRQQEIEEEKKARERPITSAERRERAQLVKDSLFRHEKFLERQKKEREDQLELK